MRLMCIIHESFRDFSVFLPVMCSNSGWQLELQVIARTPRLPYYPWPFSFRSCSHILGRGAVLFPLEQLAQPHWNQFHGAITQKIYLFCATCDSGPSSLQNTMWGAVKNEWHVKHILFTLCQSLTALRLCTKLCKFLCSLGSLKCEQGLKLWFSVLLS